MCQCDIGKKWTRHCGVEKAGGPQHNTAASCARGLTTPPLTEMNSVIGFDLEKLTSLSPSAAAMSRMSTASVACSARLFSSLLVLGSRKSLPSTEL
jgi:hypothetical protein